MDLTILDKKISNGLEKAIESIFNYPEIKKDMIHKIQDNKLQREDYYYIKPENIFNKDNTKKLFFPGKFIPYPKNYNNWADNQKKHWKSAIKHEEIRYLKILLCQKK